MNGVKVFVRIIVGLWKVFDVNNLYRGLSRVSSSVFSVLREDRINGRAFVTWLERVSKYCNC